MKAILLAALVVIIGIIIGVVEYKATHRPPVTLIYGGGHGPVPP